MVPGDKVIDTELVKKIVTELLKRQGLTVEHVAFAHPAVVLLLVRLVQLIVKQHCVTRGFCCNCSFT